MDEQTLGEVLTSIQQYQRQLDAYDQEMLWDEDDRVQKEWFSEFSTNLKVLWTERMIHLNTRTISLSTPKQRRMLGWPEDLHRTTITSRMSVDEFPSARVRTAIRLMEILRETVQSLIDQQAQDISCRVCGRKASKECTRCSTAYYCGEECQKQNWMASHHAECTK